MNGMKTLNTANVVEASHVELTGLDERDENTFDGSYQCSYPYVELTGLYERDENDIRQGGHISLPELN